MRVRLCVSLVLFFTWPLLGWTQGAYPNKAIKVLLALWILWVVP